MLEGIWRLQQKQAALEQGMGFMSLAGALSSAVSPFEE